MDTIWLLVTLVIAYLLGSIPFGLLLTKAFSDCDIRSIGSGNIGATNVMRSGKKGLAIATLLLDLLKGMVAVKLALYISGNDAAPIAGLCVVLGHIFPIWLKFKGGKGVATALGVFFGLDWMLAIMVCAIWLGVFLKTRFSSLAALLSIGISPLIACLLADNIAIFCLIIAIIITYTHRQNVTRLLNGTESAFRKTPT